MADLSDLPYPNLATCRVVLRSAPGVDKPPVRLPAECVSAAENFRLPVLYDCEVEKTVLESNKGRVKFAGNGVAELKKERLEKMMAVTNADEGICTAILENHGYDLKASIEAFFAS